jgi:hypothetical protein
MRCGTVANEPPLKMSFLRAALYKNLGYFFLFSTLYYLVTRGAPQDQKKGGGRFLT